jgi:hypothetical protein
MLLPFLGVTTRTKSINFNFYGIINSKEDFLNIQMVGDVFTFDNPPPPPKTT